MVVQRPLSRHPRFSVGPSFSERAVFPTNLAVDGAARHAEETVRRLLPVLVRLLPLIVLLTAIVGAPVMIFSPEGLPRLRSLERELAGVHEENAELEREIESLRGKVARLRDDPRAVERIARDHLGLVRPSEVVFQFGDARSRAEKHASRP
jgi:cell division protein FtsB